MTEKVKVPQNVADAIGRFEDLELSSYGIIITLGDSNQKLKREGELLRKWMYGDNGNNSDKLLAALVNGYEIEPDYTLGDKVIYGDKIYTIYQVVTGIKVNIENAIGSVITNVPIQDIRHARLEEVKADEERQKWAGIEEGDVLRAVNTNGMIGIFVETIGVGKVLVETNVGQKYWGKNQVELYAKKVGATND